MTRARRLTRGAYAALLASFLHVAWGAPVRAQRASSPAALGDARDGASRALGVVRARAEYEQAAAEYGRSRELARRQMLSDSELDARRLAVERARVDYWEEVVAAARGGSHVSIERATKRRAADGRASVRVTLRNASAATTPAPLAPPAHATDAERALDAELRRAVGGELRDVFVSLKADPGANGTTISSPYERRIARLRRNETATVEFRLFRDVTELVVSVSVGDRVEERRIVLDRDGGAARFAVQSTQLSQEVDLGAQALFDLRVVRLGAEGAARLAVGDLPAGVSAEFRDPDSKARLTQIRFPDGEDERRLQLAVTLPLRATAALRPDVPVHFAVLAADATTAAADSSRLTDGGAVAAAGRVDLELVPRGLPRVELRTQNLYHEVAPGDSVVTEVVVRNSGSRRLDDLRLRADPPAGWRATFTPALFGALPVDAERAVRLVVRPPPDVGVGDYEARIRVESAAADRRLETEDKLLRLHVADRGTPVGSVVIVTLLVAMLAVVGVVGRRWTSR